MEVSTILCNWLFYLFHIHAPLHFPFLSRHVAQAGGQQHQSRRPVRKTPHHPRPTANLAIQTLQRVVCPHVPLLRRQEPIVGQGLIVPGFYCGCGLVEPHRFQLVHHFTGFLPRRVFVCAGVNGLEQMPPFWLGCGKPRAARCDKNAPHTVAIEPQGNTRRAPQAGQDFWPISPAESVQIRALAVIAKIAASFHYPRASLPQRRESLGNRSCSRRWPQAPTRSALLLPRNA